MMKRLFLSIVLGLVAQVTAFAQGTVYFDISFVGAAPTHASFLPPGGGSLMGDFFSPIIYLNDTAPTSGQILEQQNDLSFLPISGLTVVVAAYVGGTAFSLEQSLQLTEPQIQNLLAGKWFAEVVMGNNVYTGQFVVVPEPSSIVLLTGGAMLVLRFRRKK